MVNTFASHAKDRPFGECVCARLSAAAAARGGRFFCSRTLRFCYWMRIPPLLEAPHSNSCAELGRLEWCCQHQWGFVWRCAVRFLLQHNAQHRARSSTSIAAQSCVAHRKARRWFAYGTFCLSLHSVSPCRRASPPLSRRRRPRARRRAGTALYILKKKPTPNCMH